MTLLEKYRINCPQNNQCWIMRVQYCEARPFAHLHCFFCMFTYRSVAISLNDPIIDSLWKVSLTSWCKHIQLLKLLFLVLVLTGASGWLRLWLWRHENNSGSWHLGREQPREGGPRQAEGIRIQTGIEGRSACTKQASGLKRDVPEEMYESIRLQTRSIFQIQASIWHVMTLSICEGQNLYLSP